MGRGQTERSRGRRAHPFLVAVEGGPSAGTRCVVDLQVRLHHTFTGLDDAPLLTSRVTVLQISHQIASISDRGT